MPHRGWRLASGDDLRRHFTTEARSSQSITEKKYLLFQ
jgi:hypothetical protein